MLFCYKRVILLLCHVQLFATPWTTAHQVPLFSTISQSLFKFMSIELLVLSYHVILCHLLLLLPSVFSSIGFFPVSCLFTSGKQSIAASSSVSLLPMNIQGWFPIGLTDLISLLSKGFSRVFSRLQFESIHSSVLRLLYGPTFTFIHDNWKNHNIGCMDNCWQNDVSAF